MYQGQKKERGNEVVSTNNQLKLMKTKQNSRFSSSPKVPKKQKSTYENFVSDWFSCSGTQDVSVARRAPSNPFCPVALYPRKLNGNPVFFRLCYSHQASFASLTAGHRHVCRSESKLSASSMSTPTPSGRGARCLKTKKAQSFAVLSCSGTQDWTADLMIMNWFRW